MRQIHQLLIYSVILILSLLPYLSAQAQCNASLFGGGTGTSADPYQVNTAVQLNNVRECLTGQIYFIQTANINLQGDDTSGPFYNSGAGWLPIGSETSDANDNTQNNLRFTGNYNGNGFAIENLFINRPTTNNVGLFGAIGLGGVVSRVKIIGADVTGRRGTGTVAGRIRGSGTDTRVELSSAENGTVTGHAVVGGLVGGNNSFATAPGNTDRPLIDRSFAEIDVFHQFQSGGGTPEKYGGLVGCNQKGLTRDSYALGDVIIVNTQSGVTLTRIGGFVGCLENNGRVERSYSTGTVTTTLSGGSGFQLVGAFAGNLEGTTPGAGVAGIIDDAYYTGNDVLNGLGGGTLQNADITKGTEAQFQDPGFFTTFNFSGVWSIDPDINSGFPFLTDNSPVDGIGGEADTYFSIANSDWSSAATWSTEGCGGSEASDPPPSNVAVVICNGTTVSVSDDVSNSVSVLVQDIATLSVENEGRLTISSGGFLTVESSSTFGVLTGGIAEIEGGATIENDGSIVIASGGYFYNISASNPEITMLRVLGGDAGWRYLSAPVSVTLESFLAPIWTQGVTGGNTTFGRTNIFEWPINQSGRERTEWDEITNLTTETVTAGKGYLVYVYESDLDGSNSGPKTLSVTGTEFSTTSTVITNITVDGWTLLGNPFATSVDFTEFRDTQTSGTITDAVYVWDPASDSDKPQEDFVVGDWKSFSDGTGDLTDGLISPFQAFFVQNAGTSTGVNLAFNNNVKSSMPGNTVEMFKETEQKRVRLELAGEGFKTSVWVRFSGAGSHSEFVDGDAWQLASMSAEYAVLAVQKTDRSLFDIGHFTPDDGQRIPLIAEATRRGEYTIRVTNIEGFDHSRIFLKDRDYNETIQLREGTEYRFQIDTVTEKAPADPFAILEQPIQKFSKEGITRFEIVLNSEEGFSHENPAEVSLKQNYPNPFNPTTQIRYELPQQENVRLTVYDMAGRQVAMLVNQSMNAGAHTVTFDASNLSSGVYVYRLQAGSTVLSRKLTVIK